MNMNKLTNSKRKQILHMLVEGSSMHSTSRVMDVSYNTVAKLLVDAGEVCAEFHDETVKNVQSQLVEVDELWSFIYAKDKNLDYLKADPEHAGSLWTWTALDPTSKLIIAWSVSEARETEAAVRFMADLQSRVANRVQVSSDGLGSYITAVEEAFGFDVDYAQVVKHYDGERGRHSGNTKTRISGDPDYDLVGTSRMERHNLTTRMSVRRYTRKTNVFSKKFENHCHALALYFVYYNFCRKHMTIKTTPAVKAGLAGQEYDLDWLLAMIEGKEEKQRKADLQLRRRNRRNAA